MFSTVLSAAINGMESKKVTVEADVADGLPTFTMVGYLASETIWRPLPSISWEAALTWQSQLRCSQLRKHCNRNLCAGYCSSGNWG